MTDMCRHIPRTIAIRSGRRIAGALVACVLAFVLLLPAPAAAESAEVVTVIKADRSGSWVIVQRSNGETWLLEFTIGCLTIPFYEGQQVIVDSRGYLFAGVGAKLIIPRRNQSCDIWDAELVGTRLPLAVPLLPPSSQPAAPAPPQLDQPAVRTLVAFQVGQALYARVPKGQRTINLLEMDAAPFVSGGRTFVPIRYLAASMGVTSVTWDAKTRTAALGDGQREVVLVVGEKKARVNGAVRAMDVAPVIRQGRTYLPARYVAEVFGWEVQWLPAFQAVLLLGP